jgi:penicillin-binding protein 2
MTDAPITLPGAPVSSDPRRRLAPRFLLFGLGALLAVSALGLRLFQLQVVQGATTGQTATAGLTLSTAPIPVTRGLMYDRKGRLLVKNVPEFVVRIRPAELPFEDRIAVAERLSGLLDMPSYQIIERLDSHTGSTFELVRIADGIGQDAARLIAEDQALLPGVHVTTEARRRYIHGDLLAHVVGWTGTMDAGEYERLKDMGFSPDDTIGRAGLEQTFDQELRGTPGVAEVERAPNGQVVNTLSTLEEPVPGYSLQLTIDVNVQRNAERALRWAMGVIGLKRAVFIVMDPQTGEILALVSLPSYDNNAFASGISSREYKKLLDDPSRPLLNFAIAEQYPPGSTYKLVTGSGALQDREIGPTTRLRTVPYLQIGRWRYWDWNEQGFGYLDITGGFAHSSDTFFFQLAGRLGIDRLAYYAHQFGFGEPTGIDLPGEASGNVPTDAWKRRVLNQPYYPGEVYQAGIGQGYDSVTPIQLLNAYATLANGGTLYRPQLVRRVLDAEGNVVRDFRPEVIRKLDVSKSVLRTMRVAARQVVVSRHTWNLVDLPIVVAGKTGTAEFGKRDSQGRLPYHHWFAGFVPRHPRKDPSDPNGYQAVRRDDADLAVLAFSYGANTLGNSATEIVKYFLQLQYGLRVDLRQRWILQRANFYGG